MDKEIESNIDINIKCVCQEKIELLEEKLAHLEIMVAQLGGMSYNYNKRINEIMDQEYDVGKHARELQESVEDLDIRTYSLEEKVDQIENVQET